jgi:hypothetical protein
MADIFKLGGSFKPRNVAGVKANLRTSGNIEQIVVEHSPELFDFCAEVHHSIIETHKTINKAVRRADLWGAVLAQDEHANPLPVGATAKAGI